MIYYFNGETFKGADAQARCMAAFEAHRKANPEFAAADAADEDAAEFHCEAGDPHDRHGFQETDEDYCGICGHDRDEDWHQTTPEIPTFCSDCRGPIGIYGESHETGEVLGETFEPEVRCCRCWHLLTYGHPFELDGRVCLTCGRDEHEDHEPHVYVRVFDGAPDAHHCGVCGGRYADEPWHVDASEVLCGSAACFADGPHAHTDPKDCTHLAGPPIETEDGVFCADCGVQLLHEPTEDELASIGDSEVAEFARIAGIDLGPEGAK